MKACHFRRRQDRANLPIPIAGRRVALKTSGDSSLLADLFADDPCADEALS